MVWSKERRLVEDGMGRKGRRVEGLDRPSLEMGCEQNSKVGRGWM